MILGIETSTCHASLAIWDAAAGSLAEERSFSSDRAHNAVVFEPLTELLERYRNNLTGIVVGLGPGSYSGTRVGIAIANGLSLALGIPAVGKSSLEGWETDADSYAVMGDARRNSFFLARVSNRRLQEEPALLERDRLVQEISLLAKQGIQSFTPDRTVAGLTNETVLSFPRAAILARLAAEENPDAWSHPGSLEPHYLRAPYITVAKERRSR